jgi:hypothetical protein
MKDTYTKEEVIGLLEEQKRSCSFGIALSSAVKIYPTDWKWFEETILSTPLVVESNLVVLEREKLEELERKAKAYDQSRIGWKNPIL